MEEVETKKPHFSTKHHMQVKLMINPGSGSVSESPVQLMDVISKMQAWKLVPEAYLVEPILIDQRLSRMLSGTGNACSWYM
jgi:hypothetical protein